MEQTGILQEMNSSWLKRLQMTEFHNVAQDVSNLRGAVREAI